jgi:hypothetical protein
MMRELPCGLVFFISVGFLFPAYSQTACPVGTTPGSATCGPTESAQPTQVQSVVPQTRLIAQFGAIAFGAAQGNLGFSTGRGLESGADSDAVKQCASTGGGDCKVVFRFRNSCAAVAWPYSDSRSVEVGFGANKDPAVAKIVAMQKCKSQGLDVDCEVVWEGCSYPRETEY